MCYDLISCVTDPCIILAQSSSNDIRNENLVFLLDLLLFILNIIFLAREKTFPDMNRPFFFNAHVLNFWIHRSRSSVLVYFAKYITEPAFTSNWNQNKFDCYDRMQRKRALLVISARKVTHKKSWNKNQPMPRG